jgi:hypothetical protein
MATTFEHLYPHNTPTSTKHFCRFPIAPTMQAIVVDRVPVVNPQRASIIGDDA